MLLRSLTRRPTTRSVPRDAAFCLARTRRFCLADTSKLPSQILNVFISFPSPYTQALLHRALTSHLPRLNLLPELPESPPTPLLLWCDYDILPHELLHSASASTTPTLLASSYIYRKSLIRKHYLHSPSRRRPVFAL